MVSLFKVASEVFLLALLAVTLILNINLFVHQPELLLNSNAPFTNAINTVLFKWLQIPQWLYTFIYIGVLFGSAVYFGTMMAKNRFVTNYTYLPALIFVTIFSFFNEQTYVTPIFLFLPLFVLMFNKLFEIAVYDKNLLRSLDIGLICGTLTLVYLPYWGMVIFCYVTFIIITPYYWRYWVATVIGFICPALIAIMMYSIFNDTQFVLDYLMLKNPMAVIDHNLSNTQLVLRFAILTICLTILYLFKDIDTFKVTILMKKYRNLLNALLVAIFLYQLIMREWSFELNIIVLIVIAIFTSNVIFRVKKEWISNAVHGVLLLYAFYFQYFSN